MRKILLSIALSFALIPLSANAQAYVTIHQQEPAGDNSVSLTAETNGHGTFSIILYIHDLKNAKGDVPRKQSFTLDANSGTNKEILRIYPENPSQPVTLSISYDWLQGHINAPINAEYSYRLPFGGKSLPKLLTPYEAGEMRGTTGKVFVWEFPMEKNGTILAARDGQIISVKGFANINPEDALTDGRYNSIYIEHEDGTIACYSYLSGDSLAKNEAGAHIKEGEYVKSGTPLAVAGSDDGKNYKTRFGVFYYISNNEESPETAFALKSFLNPVFVTAEGETKLTDGTEVSAPGKCETPKQNLWQRMFCCKK